MVATPAWAAPPTPPLPDCATTVTADHLTPGQSAVGFTVAQGSTVQSFHVKILGVLRDGIAPGRDLIVVDTSGPLIDQGGGIWFGMSGSPVYTLGGRLIGSISYGFSSTSSIAGVTPADPDMLGVLGEAESTLAPSARTSPSPRRVALPAHMRARISRVERVKRAAVGRDMARLEVPVSISGLTGQRRAMIRRGAREHHLPFFVPNVAGSSASAGGFGSVAPGDSFAAVVSYGDVTFGGIGTATYVCDGKALAFGHPFFFTGPATLGASAASALGIVNDPVFGPFKLAAVTDPLGTVDRDRLAGLRAELGAPVTTVPVIQDTTSLDTGRSRTGGETDIVQGAKAGFEGSLPFLAWVHSISNIDSVFDQVGRGSARISWTIRGIREHSSHGWTLTRSNRWISHGDISKASTLELFSTLATLSEQKLAHIAFTGVHIRVEVTQQSPRLTIHKVLWSKNGRAYRPARALHVDPGQRVLAHVRLRASGGGGQKTVSMRFKVPRRGGAVGLLTVGGGGSTNHVDPFCALLGICGGAEHAKSFTRLLAKLRSRPRNSDLVGQLDARHRSEVVVRHQPRVIDGRAKLLLVIGGGRHHHHHHPGDSVVHAARRG
jgi:hypothetical protein